MVKQGYFTLLLTSKGQEWQFHIATDIQWSRMAILHCYRHLVVRNGNFTFLLTSSGQEKEFCISNDILCQEWQFHTVTGIQFTRMVISLCYCHQLVKNGNFKLLQTSSRQEWQFHITTDIQGSRIEILHSYWHLVVNIGNFKLLLTS